MELHQQLNAHITRRQLFGRAATGIGIPALATLLGNDLSAQNPTQQSPTPTNLGLPGLPHFAAKAKRVIYLFMNLSLIHI